MELSFFGELKGRDVVIRLNQAPDLGEGFLTRSTCIGSESVMSAVEALERASTIGRLDIRASNTCETQSDRLGLDGLVGG